MSSQNGRSNAVCSCLFFTITRTKKLSEDSPTFFPADLIYLFFKLFLFAEQLSSANEHDTKKKKIYRKAEAIHHADVRSVIGINSKNKKGEVLKY